MSTTATNTATGTWNLDTVHSIVGFEVAYMVGTFKGRFHDVTASLSVGEDGRGTLEGAAEVASADVQNPDLNAHLLSPDFFDAEQFPELRFKAEDISLDGDRITADGEITIKGVTKPVTVTGTVSPPIVDPWGNQRLGVDGDGGGRPHGLRPQLEQPAPQRRPRARQRGHDHRRPPARPGELAR